MPLLAQVLRTDPSNSTSSSNLTAAMHLPYLTLGSSALHLPGGSCALIPGGITLTSTRPLAGACGRPLMKLLAGARDRLLMEPLAGARGRPLTRPLTGVSGRNMQLHYIVYAAVFPVGSEATTVPPSGSFLAETTRSNPESQIETNHYSDDYNRLITTLTFMSMLLGAVALISIIAHMVLAGGGAGRDNFNYRIPPSWSPENDNQYSFRAYMTDISLWVMLTDLQPHQQCAAITMRLAGSAREMARMITPQEMMFGGVRNGVAMDPVTYMLGALQTRFAALEEETRLTSMTEMLAFTRRPGESINAVLARYEIVRQRAAVEGQFVMSMEGCSLQLLRACNIQPNHLFTLLQPFRGQLPQDEPQFHEMCTQLRRFGHISEGTQGNIASSLQGPLRQARPNAYLTQGTDHPADGTTHSYFGNPGSQPEPWSDLSAQPFSAAGGTDPFATWGAGGGHSAEPSYTTTAYPVNSDYPIDSGTDTDTSSDDGQEELPDPGISQMSESQAAEHIYMEYRAAKLTWRRFTGKPVRHFRRTVKRTKGSGKAKGGKGSKGKGFGFYWTHDETLTYLKGKGKGSHSHTSGKGFGRNTNPKDRQGNTMKCRVCDSEEHFAANCPQSKGKGKGKHSSSSSSGPSPSFSGLTIAPPLHSSPEASAQPPWMNNDMMFEPPGASYPVFYPVFPQGPLEVNNSLIMGDPWTANDPWSQAAGVLPQTQDDPQSYGPARPRSRAPSPAAPRESQQTAPRGPRHRHHPVTDRHVSDDDELSRHSSPATSVRGAPHTLPTLPIPRGYTTPPSRQEWNYVGVTNIQPPEQRTGPPAVNDTQLQAIRDGIAMCSNTRPAARSVYRPHILGHNLPLSSGSITSSVPTGHVTTPAPPPGVSPVGMVTQAIELVNQLRLQRQDRQDRRGPERNAGGGHSAEPSYTPAPEPAPQRIATPATAVPAAAGFTSAAGASDRFGRRAHHV